MADQSKKFPSGEFVLDDLKHLDIETAGLPNLGELVSQLSKVTKEDGIWNDQKVLSVPVEGHPPTNLTTEVDSNTGKKPIEQNDLLFSPEVALFAAQIAHELAKRKLLPDALQKAYAQEPGQILSDWMKTPIDRLSINELERTDRWDKVLNALQESAEALDGVVAGGGAGVGGETGADNKNGPTDAEIAAAAALIAGSAVAAGGSATDDGSEGGSGDEVGLSEEEQARSRTRPQLSAPQDVMRSFLEAGKGDEGKALNTRYLRELGQIGFSADERRLIVDQTAWIYAGVLAQVFPYAVGHFEKLDAAASAQLNQLVREYILGLPNREAVLRNLIANPLARRDLIFDILQKNTTRLGQVAQLDPARIENDLKNQNREELIADQQTELEEYLIAQAAIEGTTLDPDQVRQTAYNELSKLTHAQLEGLALGQSIKSEIFASAAKQSAQQALSNAVNQISADLVAAGVGTRPESPTIENLIRSLDVFLINQGPGKTLDELSDILGGISAAELLAMAGFSVIDPLIPEESGDVGRLRDTVQSFVRARGLAFSLPTGADAGVNSPQHINQLTRDQLLIRVEQELTEFARTQFQSETAAPLSSAISAKLLDEAKQLLTSLSVDELRLVAQKKGAIAIKIHTQMVQTTALLILHNQLELLSKDTALPQSDAQEFTRALDAYFLEQLKQRSGGKNTADAVRSLSGLTALNPEQLLQTIAIATSHPAYVELLQLASAIQPELANYVRAISQPMISVHNTTGLMGLAGGETGAGGGAGAGSGQAAQISSQRQQLTNRISSVAAGVGSAGASAGGITPKEAFQSKKDASEIAAGETGSTAARSKAFFKHYLERWNTLTVDEQILVYLLTDKVVPKNYLKQNPPVDLLAPAMGFIDIESRIHTREFQTLVAELAKDRKSFSRRSRVQELQKAFLSGDFSAVDSGNKTPEAVQKAADFQERYSSSWSALSYEEKMAVYLIAGVPIAAGQDLKVIYSFADLINQTNTASFKAVVEEIRTNTSIYTDYKQQESFKNFIVEQDINTDLSQGLIQAQAQSLEAALLLFGNFPLEQQEKIAKLWGYRDSTHFIEVYQSAITGQFAAQSLDGEYVYLDPAGATQVYQLAAPEELYYSAGIENQDEHESFLNQMAMSTAAMGGMSPEEFAASPTAQAAQNIPVGRQNSQIWDRLKHARKTGDFKSLIGSSKLDRPFAQGGVKGALSAMDKGIGLGLKAIPIPIVREILSATWNNKYTKGLFAIPTLLYLKALGSWSGMLGAGLGGVIGTMFPVLGPATPFLGSFAGAMLGDWFNTQFMGGGNWFGVRLPPSPWAEPMVQSAYPSAGSASASAAATNSAEAGAGTTTQIVAAKPTAAVAIAATATAIWSVVAMPVYAILGVFVMSMTVMAVIWGAFIAPSVSEGLPTTPINEATQPAAKYATVTKTASPDAFDNPTGGQTYATKYTISIQPKPGFKLKITNVSDVYSSFGKKPAPTLTSPLTFDRLSQELTNHLQGAASADPNRLLVDELAMQYDQLGITGEDAYLINKITLTFDVYNYLSDTPIESNQTYTTSAAITIGKPQVGCWPTDGVITSVPFAGIVTHQGSDAFDIAAPLGQPITSPFVGTACKNVFDSGGYGNYVRLYVDGLDIGQGGGTLQFIFGHLNSYSPELSSSAASCQLDGSRNLISGGVPVVPGSLLGFVGSTGNSTGAHLHYELYSNYHGNLNGGIYSSLLRLLMPAGPTVQLYDSIQGCAAL